MVGSKTPETNSRSLDVPTRPAKTRGRELVSHEAHMGGRMAEQLSTAVSLSATRVSRTETHGTAVTNRAQDSVLPIGKYSVHCEWSFRTPETEFRFISRHRPCCCMASLPMISSTGHLLLSNTKQSSWSSTPCIVTGTHTRTRAGRAMLPTALTTSLHGVIKSASTNLLPMIVRPEPLSSTASMGSELSCTDTRKIDGDEKTEVKTDALVGSGGSPS